MTLILQGLTADNVDQLLGATKQSIAAYRQMKNKSTAEALENVVRTVQQMQRWNTANLQPSRPDRVGDECWYEFISHEYVDGKLTRPSQWKRGILRSWIYSNEHCIAIVEDFENHNIETAASLSFSTEAPQ